MTHGLVVGQDPLGALRGPPGVVDGLVRGPGGHGGDEVVGQLVEVLVDAATVGAEHPLERLAHAPVDPRPLQAAEAGVEGLSHQGVGEPARPGVGLLDDQAHGERRLHQRHQAVELHRRHFAQQVEIEAAPDHGRHPQQRLGVLGEAGQSPVDGVAHAAGHVEGGGVAGAELVDGALAGEEADQFDEEERVPVGAVVQGRCQPGIRRRGPGGELEVALDVARIEALQGQALGVPLPGEGPQQVLEVGRHRVALTHGGHHCQRGTGQLAGKEGEELARRGVGPVQVVDHHQEWPAPRRRQEVLGHLLVEAEARFGGVAGGTSLESFGEAHGQGLTGAATGLVVVVQRPQHLDPGPVRRGAGCFGAAAPADGHALGGGNGRRLLDEAGLADARFALDEDHAALTLGRLHHSLDQASELGRSPHQGPLVAASVPACAGCRVRAGGVTLGLIGRCGSTGRGGGCQCHARRDKDPGRHQLEGGVLGDDGLLQAAQLRAGLEAQLLTEDCSTALVRPQGVGLALAAVQRDHPLSPEPLPQRVLGDQAFELGHGRAVAPLSHPGVDAVLLRLDPSLQQAGDLRLGERLSGDVGQGVAPPQGQRLGHRRVGLVGPAVGQELLGVVHQVVEAQGVDLFGTGSQHVARGLGDQDTGHLAGATARLEQAPEL